MKNNELTEVKPVMPSLEGLPQDVIEYVHGLVSENLAMRKAIDETIGWQESVDPSNAESVRLLVALQTPSTDAFTAELHAQGVELLRDSIPDIETGIEDTRDLNHYCTDFAANLRAGRKG